MCIDMVMISKSLLNNAMLTKQGGIVQSDPGHLQVFIENWDNTPKMETWQFNFSLLYDQEKVETVREEIKVNFIGNNRNQIKKN